jgi:urea transport system ATP-binding protein
MAQLLHVDNISVSFDGFKAINALSFDIGQAELRAIIGPNGAGKTTFMDIVTGKTRPDSGDVRWGATSISLLKRSESQIAQLGIGRKFQKPTTFEDQTVHDNLMMSLANRRNPLAVLSYRRSRHDEDRILEIADLIKLIDSLNRLAGELSHGQKQWLEIGMLLAQDPKLMLVDEPAAGMTAPEREVTVELLKNLSQTRSVIVVEHDMEFIRALNCRVTVLHEGAVLAEGSMDFVTGNQQVIDVYLGR